MLKINDIVENGIELEQAEREEREDARRFILDGIDAEVPPMQLLDELASFYDGDPCDLF